MFDQKPIPLWVAVIMVVIALAVDVLQLVISFFLPVAGDFASGVTSVLFYGIYYLWFKIGYGIDFTNTKRMLSTLGGGIIEAAGVVLPADLPGLTINVILIIVFSKMPSIQAVVTHDPRALAKEGVAVVAQEARGIERAALRGKVEVTQGRLRNQLRSFPRNFDMERAAGPKIFRDSPYRKAVRRGNKATEMPHKGEFPQGDMPIPDERADERKAA